jgi:hypothetical protein
MGPLNCYHWSRTLQTTNMPFASRLIASEKRIKPAGNSRHGKRPDRSRPFLSRFILDAAQQSAQSSSLSLPLCHPNSEATCLVVIDEVNSSVLERRLNFEQS